LLTAEQAGLWNPIVVLPYKASNLPDAPATKEQLDKQCAPVKIAAAWYPPQVS
jgi:hypothetical protein